MVNKNSTSKIELTKEQALEYYETLMLIRRFEERAAQLYGTGNIAGFLHLYIGQEAVSVGTIKGSKPEIDCYITSYRCHSHLLILGESPANVMSELTGKQDGVSKGLGGSMHMFSPKNNFYGGHGIVGAQVPLGTGIAFAQKYQKEAGVTFIYFGDGAADQGQVYESFNLATLYKLPAIFVVENNKYSMGTAVHRHTTSTDYYKRGAPWNIKAQKVDGMNLMEVLKATKEARKYVTENSLPYILEFETYRYKGHSMSDPALYRSKEETDEMKTNRDVLKQFRNTIFQEKLASEEELKQIDKKVLNEVKKYAKHAQEAPELKPTEILQYVYAK